MCGIIGLTGTRYNTDRFRDIVKILSHRGPDGNGQMIFDNMTFLGHTRLSVIDLSTAGNQPMSNEDDTLWLVYNGEIYNFKELRSDLEKHGHRFKSECDAEVILHLYEEKGHECVEYLNGMFAFAVYDKKKQQIFLARDRLGIKPLYYSHVNGSFVFSSEIKAILATDIVPKNVNWQAIYDYFSFLYVPCPHTAFEGIKQLPPAHFLVFDLDRKNYDLKCYWTPYGNDRKREYSHGNYTELKDELRALVKESVNLQLVSDVPLGVFLSGGIDSSILAAIASENCSERLKTFTVVFEGEGIGAHDDREYALTMSRFLNTEHREITVDISDPEKLFDLINCFDQPYANPTFYLSYLISRETKKHVTVALSGAGGDELFGGYPRYKVLQYSKMLSLMPDFFGKAVSNAANIVPENPDNPLARRVKLFLRGIGQDFDEQYLRWTYYFSDEDKKDLLSSQLAKKEMFRPSTNIISRYLSEFPCKDVLNQVQYVDIKTFLLDNILEYSDKTSMAVGLETRVPFLDHRIAELSFRIPQKFKINRAESKFILKDAFKETLPDTIYKGPKRGFCAPVSVWINKHLDFYFTEVLTPQYIKQQGVLNYAHIQKLRIQHDKKIKDNSMELFGIIMFDLWYRKYIDN